MSLEICRKALEKRLATLTPAIAIAFENDRYTPTVSTPYLQAFFKPNTTNAPSHSQQTKIERGFMQVSVHYPLLQGTTAAGAKAEAVRAHFPAGLMIAEGGLKIRISMPPSVAGGITGDTHYTVPVTIYFISIK